ncbi:FAD-dependent oxidoreductase [Paenibacillus sp. LjRoot56]|uniref:FAD-dependent oxidoreductase n=1 Tax=Paenibacillus sp. LjRoot56 TaxID=3342333 RepID=UPI003ECF5040
MKDKFHKTDLCIIGGGIAGMCAAIAAARHGAKVVLMQDRPVLGGNASSEIRMNIGGALGLNNRETGLLEEFEMENLSRNHTANYSIWDSVLYEKVRFEENITLLLNCSCMKAEMDGNIIKSVKGWQMTTETWHSVQAAYFADCSGDGILAPLTGAEFRIGREAASEFNESIEPEQADSMTMGISCLFQIRETDKPQPFTPPSWANTYTSDEDLPHRQHDKRTNFWWIELGGDRDSIHDAEEIKDELLKIVFGVWDHMKNHGDHGVENWVIDWIGFVPGKRESRRYVGDYMLTQNDIEAEGKFDDLVAYGGWSMDDHFPAGFHYKDGHPTIYHRAPSPYGIPYRSLYSRNIGNLFFAGRNISATHAALSSTRVMGTCSLLGQAIGTAAALAIKDKLTPREIYRLKIRELQDMLMEDDCYLPWRRRTPSLLTQMASLTASNGNAEVLRNGYDRTIGEADNGWIGKVGDWIEYRLERPQPIGELRLVLDSNLNRKIRNMPNSYPLNNTSYHVPQSMLKDFRVEVLDSDGSWRELLTVTRNYQRLRKLKIDITTHAVRLIPLCTWGSEQVHIFSWEIRS